MVFGLVTPQDGLVTPQFGELRPTSQKNMQTFAKIVEIASKYDKNGLGVFKMAESDEKRCFTFFAFLPPYIGVSGSRMYAKR